MELFITKEEIIITDLEREFSNFSNDKQHSVSPVGPHPNNLSLVPLNIGYVYCLSNPLYEGIYKVGFTANEPDIRMNQIYTTGVPLPFKLEFAKKVNNYQTKEKTLHKILTQYGERINPRREFFKISLAEIRTFFDLMDGTYYVENSMNINLDGSDDDEDDRQEEQENISEDNISIVDKTLNETRNETRNENSWCRDITKCFYHGQKICHQIGITDIWFGFYDENIKKIVREGVEYGKLSTFSNAHYKESRPDKSYNSNGWLECECELEDGTFVSTFKLNSRENTIINLN
jgi:hypothetical protein